MQKRLVISFVIIMCLTLSLSYILFLNIYSTQAIKLMSKNLNDDAAQIIYLSENTDSLKEYIKKYADGTNNDVLVTKNGKIIAGSWTDKKLLADLQDKMTDEGRADLVKIEEDDRLISAAASSEDRTVSVFLSASYNKNAAFDADAWAYLILIFIIDLIISTVLWYRFIYYNMRSIKTITNAVNNVANGTYSGTIRYEYDDEIGDLIKTFNYMAAKLKSTMQDMYDRNSKLEAVLKSIVNGVIAIDNSGRVILINDSAKNILDIVDYDVIGKHLLEVVRNYKLAQSLEDYINNRTDMDMDFEINLPQNKTLRVYINPIMSTEHPNSKIGSVIVFNDITELKKLEKIRSDFVANVSHELRTPLTSIKGFVETLQGGNVKDAATLNKFLDIISLETDRLTRLINDILTLSEIENVKDDVKKEYVNLKDEVENVVYILDNKAHEKNIKVSLSIRPDDLQILADRDWIHQLLLNLIDNAIKYNKDSGYIWIKAWKDDNDVFISVEDTGIGIEEEHIPRIFERFYRVDKGRSRNSGGTGLGLAIVKHIVESMDGNIQINSIPGSGTEFLIALKNYFT